MMTNIIIVSGYFNPLHRGHIEYFSLARKYGDKLFVIVNNDAQRKLKGSKEFQGEEERLLIVSSLEVVDKAVLALDQDRTVRQTLKSLAAKYSNGNILHFANGGDQNNDTIPEKQTCVERGIRLIDGLGDKIQSSSWLLEKK